MAVVERTTQLLMGRHLAENTASPLLGAEARAHSPEGNNTLRAIIDEVIPEPEVTPEIPEEPELVTLRQRVSGALQGLFDRMAS